MLAFAEIKYYLGAYFFYVPLFLIFNNRPEQIQKLLYWFLWILSLSLLIEAACINLIPSSQGLFANIPDFVIHKSHRTNFFGMYQRPYGLGASFAETTALIAVLLTFFAANPTALSKRARALAEIIGIAAICCGMSGTGFAMLGLYLVFRTLHSRLIPWGVVVASIAATIPFAVQWLPGYTDESPLRKVSWEYIEFLVKLKISSIKAVANSRGASALWFGNLDASRTSAITWSDFGVSGLFEAFGLLSLCTLLVMVLLHTNRRNIVPILLMCVSLFHYSAMFCAFGQAVFVLLLLYK